MSLKGTPHDKPYPLAYAGATVNQQFDQFVQDNFPDLYDEYLLGACDYLDLDAWLEMENGEPLSIFENLRRQAAKQAWGDAIW